jgi:hypothetical protein
MGVYPLGGSRFDDGFFDDRNRTCGCFGCCGCGFCRRDETIGRAFASTLCVACHFARVPMAVRGSYEFGFTTTVQAWHMTLGGRSGRSLNPPREPMTKTGRTRRRRLRLQFAQFGPARAFLHEGGSRRRSDCPLTTSVGSWFGGPTQEAFAGRHLTRGRLLYALHHAGFESHVGKCGDPQVIGNDSTTCRWRVGLTVPI